MQFRNIFTLVMVFSLAVGLVTLMAASCAKAEGEEPATAGGAKVINAVQASVGDPYPLNTCPVTGEELGGMGDPVIYDYNGREIRFCCKGCIKKFEADPDKYIKAIDKQITAEQGEAYPLDNCVVTGEKLGGMGKTVDFVYNNRLFKLCCGGCIGKIKQDPATYLGKLDDAVVKAQLADYPLDTCVVTGEKLGSMGDPVDYVFANRLVRFCCKGCIEKFEADPQKYLEKLN